MQIHAVDIVAPGVVAILFIVATSSFKEPQRMHFNAIMIVGAGAAYLNGGLGIWVRVTFANRLSMDYS
jgi:Family of unknown function (DUF6010)